MAGWTPAGAAGQALALNNVALAGGQMSLDEESSAPVLWSTFRSRGSLDPKSSLQTWRIAC